MKSENKNKISVLDYFYNILSMIKKKQQHRFKLDV